jgi:hypothetical protein
MLLPAQNCTTVATTKMAGMSQSIVSMYRGTYIRAISPSPAASATCHLRFIRASSRSRSSAAAVSAPTVVSDALGPSAARRGVAV